MRPIARALGAIVAGTILSLTLSAAPALQVEELPKTEFPRLCEVSKELTRLRARATELSVTVFHGRESRRGIYLGEGLVVTPYFEGLERGCVANMVTTLASYRVRCLASAKPSKVRPLVTFYRLHDPVDRKPALARTAPLGWRDRLGDLVFVRQRHKHDFHMVRSTLRFGQPRSGVAADAAPFAYRIAVDQCDPGSLVLACDASMVGMVVQVERRRRRPRRAAKPEPKEQAGDASKKDGAAPRAEASEPVQYSYMALDPRWLLARGKLSLEEGLPELDYSIGVSLGEFGGNKVIRRVYEGSPAQRAGVRRRDEILSIDGRPFEKLGQLHAAIVSGKAIELRYRRRVRGSAPIEGKYIVQPRR